MSPHKHYFSILMLLICIFISVGMVNQKNVNAISSNSITVAGEVTVDVATDGNGASIGTDTIKVDSTCATGYTLSIGGGNDNNLYLNGDSNNTFIAPSTGTKLAPTTIIGEGKLDTWGYSIESGTTIHSNTFIGLTNNINELFSKESASAAEGDNYEVHYGVSVSPDKRAGLYKMAEGNTITYYLTTPVSCQSFKIVYNDNNANSPTTMAVMHEDVGLESEINLYASNYQRPGYGFAGWSTEQLDPDAADFAAKLTEAINDGMVFGPNETITINEDIIAYADPETNVIPLYAVWIKSAGDLQGWTGCSSMDIGSVTALKDTRDNSVYAVGKLADNNCWMIENLKLGVAGSDDESKTQGFGGVFHGLADPEEANFIESTVSNSLYSVNGSTLYTIDPATHTYNGDNSGFYFPRYNDNNTTHAVETMNAENENIYSYGNYYTMTAAVANTDLATGLGNVDTSICPLGWDLPAGASITGRSFGALSVALGGASDGSNANNTTVPTGAEMSNRFRAFPNNFVHSGRYNDSSAGARDTIGAYWTKTSYSFGASFYFFFTYDEVRPSSSTVGRARGNTMRCVVKNTYTVSFNANGGSGEMGSQEIDNGIATNLSNNTFTAPTNLAFGGWNTEADGSGTSYADGASVTDLGDITLYAQWICPPNSICYDDNGANSPTRMGNQNVANNATSIDLWASNFQYQDTANPSSATIKGFAGWNTKPDGTGMSYGPNETITDSTVVAEIKTSGLKLYAMWKDSVGSLQSWTGCSALTSGQVIALTDIRDNNVYAVAKLADDNCWMIENLRLDDSAMLTTANTNRPLNVSGAVAIRNHDGNTTNHLSASMNPITTAWCTEYSANCYDKSILFSGNTISPVEEMTGEDANIYNYGSYYNWYSATAGNGVYSKSSGSTVGDICPVGWHLPIGGSTTTGFGGLDFALGGTGAAQSGDSGIVQSRKWRAYPNNFVFSGRAVGSSVWNRNANGGYWSSTADNNLSSRGLTFDKNNLAPGSTSYYKYTGFMVRCTISSS